MVGSLTQRILILGMNSYDSGKTILSKMLAETFVKQGKHVEYLKPISGHNYWYRSEHTQFCIEDSLLASWDATLVRQVLNSRIPIELANPIHSLFVPAVLEKPEETLSSTLAIGGWDSVLALQRYTTSSEDGTNSITLTAKNLIDSGKLMLTKSEAANLTQDSEIVPFDRMEAIEEFASQHLEKTLDAALYIIEKNTDVLIIEGFNDSAWPWEGLDRVDNIIVTGPGHVFSYNPERFRKAAFLVKYGSQPIREVSFSRVSDMIKPTMGIHLRPQTGFTDSQLEQLGLKGKKD
jgi:predicted P-loop ATPase/GTPase